MAARRALPNTLKPRFRVGRRGVWGAPARLVAILLPLTLLAPAFVCGAAPTTRSGESPACCRAMNIACHERGTFTCCEHQSPATDGLTLGSPVRAVNRPQPAGAIVLLPAASILGASSAPSGESAVLSAAHSPPTSAPLFLLYSILLI